MDHATIPYLREALIFLAATGIAVPLLTRLRINAIIGYLLIGGLIGPFGLGLLAQRWSPAAPFAITDIEGVKALAEIGIVFLMFVIGLELSIERLWKSRRLVFGVGLLQILVTAAIISLAARLFGLSVTSALVIGAALSLSSTAVVMQLLIDRHRQLEPVGQASFSILLMQDLAVVPILFLVAALAGGDARAAPAELAIALAKAALAIVAIYGTGRLLLRPVLRQIAQAKNFEMFTAAVLLAALGVAAVTANLGLSMALGALLAGVLLAETEYRHQIEVDIAPFKGLLLGLFFMSVGMGIDWRQIGTNAPVIIAIIVGLWALKAAIIFCIARFFGQRRAVAIEAGLLLGQGGEFAFVILASAAAADLVSAAHVQTIHIVASVGMLLTPVAARLAGRAGAAADRYEATPDTGFPRGIPAPQDDHVIIAGFGRVGQALAHALEAEGVEYVAIDADARLVAALREKGSPIYFGDASRADILDRAGIKSAAAVAVTMNSMSASNRIVSEIGRRWPRAPVHARARDPQHARRLRELGATSSIPETIEASLQLASNVLADVGLDTGNIERRIAEQRLAEGHR